MAIRKGNTTISYLSLFFMGMESTIRKAAVIPKDQKLIQDSHYN